MVLPQHLADDTGGFAVGAIGQQPQLVHCIENPPLHGLESIAHVRQRPRHDDGHGVIEKGIADLVLDEPRHHPFELLHIRKLAGKPCKITAASTAQPV
jgi:hypothetical protein